MSRQAHTAAFEFSTEVYRAVDSMDEQRLASFLTENCRFVYANNNPVIGRANAAASSKKFLDSLAAIKHDLLEVWSFDDVIVSQIEVTYTRKDETTLTIPAATIWRVRGGQIDEYRIYVDVGPLFSH
ncbi:nuclear transport factor 2 family protein [Paraburkholderia sp. 1N]|uniref:Nuclear transport factor 2 family protein n=1 Tax=Paraburkholderia solitsugae TaxID=2675748 RepID=A0ABX2C211_9BURK|nr:nuclear transport factor 2 family protein [Paraburkholderia solitsugae]NPT46293.1 nuclear transport factor 2 family protein [Paraburkholderia solitsugae]